MPRSRSLALLLPGPAPRAVFAYITALALASSAFAATPPCRPCAGVHVDDPATLLEALAAEPRIEGEARLYVAWPVELTATADASVAADVAATGARPWIQTTFRTPAPLLDHLDALEAELAALARLARAVGRGAHVQLGWTPAVGASTADDVSFLLKRAAVAVTGAAPEARVIFGPLDADADALRALYAEEIAAYVDGIALAPADDATLRAALTALAELDPGKPAVLDRLPWPAAPESTLAEAAAATELGVGVVLFDAQAAVEAASTGPRVEVEVSEAEAIDSAAVGSSDEAPSLVAALAPLKILAREFQGDLSLDPYTPPLGARRAWTFVRGEDLSLRVIAEAEPGADRLPLYFDDGFLRAPRRISLRDGEESLVLDQTKTAQRLSTPIREPRPVELLRLQRVTAADLEGVEEEVQVADERQIPVEEILRRLQAFEDEQDRRLDHYQATNTLHLRFRLGDGVDTVEVTFEGPFFYRRNEGFDWAWEKLFVNGVQWRGRELPEIPLIQPEKAAVLPLEINFTQEYAYRLRGSDTLDGREAWVIDFEPVVSADDADGLYQGTVWVDKNVSARLRTRALQIGLEGDVISNEETVDFSPVSAAGEAVDWDSPERAFVLPLSNTGQQILSVLNATTQVVRQTELTNVRLNAEDFATARQATLDSDVTMVRDTNLGLRYLEKDEETGERVVQMQQDSTRLFAIGGTFYDESLDYPIPLLGANWLDLDWYDGQQLNVFFAGALLTASWANPGIFGGDWEVGASTFGQFFAGTDEFYRDGREIEDEELENNGGRISLFLGRSLGSFAKLDFSYILRYERFSDTDETADAFILPEDHFTHSFETELTYARSGWQLNAEASWNQRSGWEFWGLPGNTEFDPEQEDYLLYKASIAKTWFFPKFRKLGIELEHLGGEDLDRFSKYDFGTFGDGSVAGYQNGLVRAEEASGFHVDLGIGVSSSLQLGFVVDALWVTDEVGALEDELLAGVGVEGTIPGPWSTLVNLEIGVPVEGPGDGFSAYIVFLKPFNR